MMGMEIKNVDEFIRVIVNDRRIFFYFPGAQLFGKKEMEGLKEKYKNNKTEFVEEVRGKIEEVKREIENLKKQGTNGLKKKIENRGKCIKLAEAMIKAVGESPNLLEEQLSMLDDFGILSTNLAYLEDIGQVMEENEKKVVKEFILYKIQKERDKYKKRVLQVLLDYADQLYKLDISVAERGFIIRKLDALKIFSEVIMYE
jgi:hypothetical protein